MPDQKNSAQIRREVHQHYATAAQRRGTGCCGAAKSACCGGDSPVAANERAVRLGYTVEDADSASDAASMSLGCGNPGAIASLQPGEIVLDLGSGGGFDCLLAAQQVGETGRVIGVDMTPDMIATARENAARAGYANIEFRLGEIEHLPVADSSVDVIISNCVINLSPDKQAVFQEAFRVLRPGGRLAIADIVATAPLPTAVRQDMDLWAACIAGAAEIGELVEMLRRAGFTQVRVQPQNASREMIAEWAPGFRLTDYVVSATIEAGKPVCGDSCCT